MKSKKQRTKAKNKKSTNNNIILGTVKKTEPAAKAEKAETTEKIETTDKVEKTKVTEETEPVDITEIAELVEKAEITDKTEKAAVTAEIADKTEKAAATAEKIENTEITGTVKKTKKTDKKVPVDKTEESNNSDKKREIKWIRFLFYPISLVYMELLFHFYVLHTADINLVYPILFALGYGIIITVPLLILKGKLCRILSYVFMIPIWFFFNLQLVYFNIFKTFISVYSITQNAGDVTEFWREALNGILRSLPCILLLSLPIAALIICYKKKWLRVDERVDRRTLIIVGITAVVFNIAVAKGAVALSGDSPHEVNDLYNDSFILDLGIDKMGVMTSTMLDVKMVFFSDGTEIEEPVFVALATPTPTVAPVVVTPKPTQPAPTQISGVTPTPTLTPTPTPTPIDTSPNVLDIDFASLAETEKKEKIANIHKYMANAVPTNKNEYTGMFEGYNLIFLTAEGFSPWAVDEKLTPTLYKLVNNGFVFKNFYTPIWYTSTSDGEYVACTSLIPYSTNSFKRSAANSMPLCMGHMFNKLGYPSKAWHDHSYTYYGRDKTHPNMGYEFKAKGHGLDITPTWPESDLEMMELTVSEYINEEKFNVYYMTVSGHLEYNFGGNKMSAKHKEEVASLPYSDPCKAYIACNMELDLALEYLINQLETAGIADKTVIALSADHYPYGLEINEIEEIAGHEVDEDFELYRNHFILWSGSIEEPIVIDEYCSSLDIIPTLCNLFGLEYDSRLYIGQDILSDAPPLVMFSNQSFITESCKYNSKKRTVEALGEEEPTEEYINNAIAVVRNKFNISHSILLNDYYRYIEEYLPTGE